MAMYLIDYAINGTIAIEADSADAAIIEFDAMSAAQLGREGDVERLTDPQTKEEKAAEEAAWKASWKRTLDESING